MWESAATRNCGERLVYSLSYVLSVVGKLLDSSSGMDSDNISRRFGGSWDRLSIVASSLSFTFSLAV